MATTATADDSRPVFGEQQLLAEYNKLIKLRDEVFAQQGVQVRTSNATVVQSKTSTATRHPPAPSTLQAINGHDKVAKTNSALSAQLPNVQNLKPTQNAQPRLNNAQKLPALATKSSGIDPIFLQKSNVLVKAEIYQKRQRIERVLGEQVAQKEKQMARSIDALPDFDATEVLRKAHELVKPQKVQDKGRLNGTNSSSDSFDENTYYSSQMDESTTTEEVDEARKADESKRLRPHQLCNFFRKGVKCKFGDKCVFSHDPALRQKLEPESVQAINSDNVNANHQISSRLENDSRQRGVLNLSKVPPPTSTETNNPQLSFAEKERMLQERVAQLEDDLRRTLAAKQDPLLRAKRDEVENQDGPRDPAYSPPPPDEFGRDAGLRVPVQQPPLRSAQPLRENGKRSDYLPSPLHNDMRIVRSNIPSPLAPQPQRVSPLAVAKAPQVSQFRRIEEEDRHEPGRRTSDILIGSSQQSPIIVQPPSSKKRRRGPDSGEETRNVIPRREHHSPAVQIKAEAISPPPFALANSIREARQHQEQQQQIPVDDGGRPPRNQDTTHEHPRNADLLTHDRTGEDRRPVTPLARRVLSRNGQQFLANTEPDLRRVVSARHVRAPLSPALYPAQYSAPQARATRAASQIYASPTGHGVPQQYESLGEPSLRTTLNERSPSPIYRVPRSPVGRHAIMMAPPPRRIVIDKYGNQFEEVPLARERQMSLVPIRREDDYERSYAQVVPRNGGARQPRYLDQDEDDQYLRRAPSPMSPTFIEYPRSSRTKQVIGPRGELYESDSYMARHDGPRVVEGLESQSSTRYIESQSEAPRYEEVRAGVEGIPRVQSVRPNPRYYVGGPPLQEGTVRMQSVRPTERQYEDAPERIQRVHSVRPQPRIVNLGEKGEPRPQMIRHVSVRPDSGLERHVEYMPNERARYQYAGQGQAGGYMEETQEDGRSYGAEGTVGRRVMQQHP